MISSARSSHPDEDAIEIGGGSVYLQGEGMGNGVFTFHFSFFIFHFPQRHRGRVRVGIDKYRSIEI